MTLTLELSPAEQARLTDAARQTGLEPADLVKQWVAERLPAFTEAEAQEAARVARIKASRGSLAHLGSGMVEELHRERQVDKEKEEQWIAGYLK